MSDLKEDSFYVDRSFVSFDTKGDIGGASTVTGAFKV